MYLGIVLIIALAGVGVLLHRLTHPNDDKGSVSGNWLAEERGKRDGET